MRKVKVFIGELKKIMKPLKLYLRRLRVTYLYIPYMNKVTARSNMRHEAHRIEKSYYNAFYSKKLQVDKNKVNAIFEINDKHKEKLDGLNSEDVKWSYYIAKNSDSLYENYIKQEAKKKQQDYSVNAFYNILNERTSVRLWSQDQPSKTILQELAERLIMAAISMPSSGNRQGVRFMILTEEADKINLRGIKEEHCVSAPLVILVFSDVSVYGSYGSFGKNEECILIDAAAAAATILISAEVEGYSTCWNHFGMDLMSSRKKNKLSYKTFVNTFGLSKNLHPVAAIAIGKELFQPPKPPRMDLKEFVIYK